MPYPSYRTFQLMYMIEPWGWENLEYLFSMLASMILNVNVDEKHKRERKNPGFFMRDMPKLIIGQLNAEKDRLVEMKKLSEMTRDEKRAYYLTRMKQTFGGR